MCSVQHDVGAILHPVVTLSRVVGLTTFNLETKNRSVFWTYYASFIIALYILQYSFNGLSLVLFFVDDEDGLSKSMSIATSSVTEMLSTISSLVISFKRYADKMNIILMLFETENNLAEINIGVKFSKCSWYRWMIKSGMILLCCFVVDWIGLTAGGLAFAITSLTLRYSAMVICWINICYFLTILRIVRIYFKCINDDLNRTRRLLKRKTLFTNRFAERIAIICRIHSTLRKICRMHGSVNGLPLSFLSMFLTSVTTTMSYFFLSKYIVELEYPDDQSIKSDYGYFVYWVIFYISFCFTFLEHIVSTVHEVSEIYVRIEFE